MSDKEKDSTMENAQQCESKNLVGRKVIKLNEVTENALKTDIVYSGTCRWYNAEKGYGFLAADDNQLPKDACVHISNINTNNCRDPSDIQLHPGQHCTFQIQLKKSPADNDELRITAVNVVPEQFVEKEQRLIQGAFTKGLAVNNSQPICSDEGTNEFEKQPIEEMDRDDGETSLDNDNEPAGGTVDAFGETQQLEQIEQIKQVEQVEQLYQSDQTDQTDQTYQMDQTNQDVIVENTDHVIQDQNAEQTTHEEQAVDSGIPKDEATVEKQKVSANSERFYKGICLRFDEKKGYGFLKFQGDRNGHLENIFVHRKSVKGNGVLQVGQKTRFRVLRLEDGRLKAVDVVPEKFSVDPQSIRVHKGVVTAFYRERGFGFIKGSDGDERVFVHSENVVGQSLLSIDQAVEYKVRNQLNTKENEPMKKEAFEVVPGKLTKKAILSGKIASIDPNTGLGVIKCASPNGEIKRFAFLRKNVIEFKGAQANFKDSTVALTVGQPCTFMTSVDRKNKPCAIKIKVTEKVLTDGDYLGFEPYLPEHFEQAKAIKKRKEALDRKQAGNKNGGKAKTPEDPGNSRPSETAEKAPGALSKSQKKKLKRKLKKSASPAEGKETTAPAAIKPNEEDTQKEMNIEEMSERNKATKERDENPSGKDEMKSSAGVIPAAENGNKTGPESFEKKAETTDKVDSSSQQLKEEKTASVDDRRESSEQVCDETKSSGRKRKRKRPPKFIRKKALEEKAEEAAEAAESNRAKKGGRSQKQGKSQGLKGGKKSSPKGKGATKEGKRRESRSKPRLEDKEAPRGFFATVYSWLFGGLV